MLFKLSNLNIRSIEVQRSYTFSKANGWFLFSLVLAVYLLLTFLSNQYIFNDEIFYRSYSDQVALHSIETFLDMQQRFWWLGYVILPFILLGKISFTAICISIAAVLSTIVFKFKTIFKAAILAEVVFIIAHILYLINLYLHVDTLTLETASSYYPLSALSYLGTENVIQWLQYPLQKLNMFEGIYMIVIAWLLSKQWKEDFMESLALVIAPYGMGLILWLVFVTFITLQIS